MVAVGVGDEHEGVDGGGFRGASGVRQTRFEPGELFMGPEVFYLIIHEST